MFRATYLRRTLTTYKNFSLSTRLPMSCGARRAFSSAPQGGSGGPGAPGGGPGGPNKQDDGFLTEDEDADGEKFESNRRFSNFTFFAGSLTLLCLLMYSNVMQNQRTQKRD